MARWRLGARLRQQDWIAFAIDLAIVVVGVFLGIQASNWNQSLSDARRGEAYRTRIDADLHADISGLQHRLEYWRQVQDYATTALSFAEARRPSNRSPWEVLLAFYQASQIWIYTPTNSTYEELTGAGQLELLGDSNLRSALANYYVSNSRWRPAMFEVQPAYREHVRMLIPSGIQTYIWQHCHSPVTDTFNRFFDCPSPVALGEALRIDRELAADRQLIGELRFWRTNLQLTQQLANVDLTSARKLSSEIETKLY